MNKWYVCRVVCFFVILAIAIAGAVMIHPNDHSSEESEGDIDIPGIEVIPVRGTPFWTQVIVVNLALMHNSDTMCLCGEEIYTPNRWVDYDGTTSSTIEVVTEEGALLVIALYEIDAIIHIK